MTVTLDQALVQAVAAGLTGADLQPMAVTEATLNQAVSHRVQGLLARALDLGVVTADAQTAVAVRDIHVAALRTCLIAEETAVLAADALATAGIGFRILKGVAIAHLDHDPSDRVFGDADVLIARRDHGSALDALQRAGFVRDEPPVRGWWERRYGKAIIVRAPHGGELDLHVALTGGYFGHLLTTAELIDRPGDSLALAGRQVMALDPADRLLHACCHAVLGGGSGLRALRDIAQLVLVSDADWQLTVARAERVQAGAVVALAVQRTWAILQLPPDHAAAVWANNAHVSALQQQMLDSYEVAFGSNWMPEGRSLLRALGPVDRALCAIGLAFPSRASLRARHRTLWQHLRRGSATIGTSS